MAKTINVVYKVDDKELLKAKGAIQGIEKETKDSEKEMLKLNNTIKQTGNQGAQSFLNFKNILGAISVTAIVAGLTSLGKKIFDLGVKQEQLNIAFTTFLGSATRAKNLMAELNKFAIVTPFTPDQVNNAAKALLAFGVQGEEIIPTLKMLGDVSSGTGKDLTEMAIIFGQIRSTGRLMGQDLLQLINAGFNPLQIISEKTGKSVKTLKQEMEKGNISFQMVADAFKTATTEGGLFFNLMEKQSQSIGGIVSTIEGNIDEGLKNLFQGQSGLLKEFVDSLNTLSEAFREFTKSKEQIVDEKEAELINDATKAYDLQVKAFGNSANARERIIELIAEQKARIEEESQVQAKIANQEISFFDINKQLKQMEKDRASAKLAQLNDEAILYDLKVIPALDEHILKTGLSKKVVEDEGKAHKKTAKEIKERADALAAINKQLGISTAAQKVTEREKEEKEQDKRDKEANERSNKNLDRQLEYQNEKLKQAKEQEYKILEEAAERRRNLEQQIRNFAIDSIQQVLYATLLSNESSFEDEKERFDREIELAGDNERAKDNIRRREEDAEKAFRARQKNEEKQNALKRIAIDTAINVIRSIANNGGIPLGLPFGALAAAAGIVQAATVRKLAKGEVGIKGPGTSTSDSIPAMLSRGESVIAADPSSKSPRLLEAINNRQIDDRILSGAARGGSQAVQIDYERMGEEFRKGKESYDTHGYTIMKGIQKGKNFKIFIRSKVQGY